MKEKGNKKKALRKNIIREISRTKSRFFSIFAIIGISVGFFTGLKSACPSMIETAQRYFDEYNLMDFSLISTIGFDNNDINELKKLDFVEDIMPSYMADMIVSEGDVDNVARVMALSDGSSKINIPMIKEGTIPQNDGECLIESYYARLAGKKIGDTITFTSPNNDMLKNTKYKIVGIADSPIYVSYTRGNTNIGNGSISFYILVRPEEFSSERYMKVFIRTKASQSDFSTFSDEYKNMIQDESDILEELSFECIERFNSETLYDAQQKLADAKKEFSEKKSEVMQKISDGEKELQQGEKELNDKITEGQKQLDDGQKQIDQLKQELINARNEYDNKLLNAEKNLNYAKTRFENKSSEYNKIKAEYDSKIKTLQKNFDDAEKDFRQKYDVFYKQTKPLFEQQLDSLQSKIDFLNAQIQINENSIRRRKNLGLDTQTFERQIQEYQKDIQSYQKQYAEISEEFSYYEQEFINAENLFKSTQQDFENEKNSLSEKIRNAKNQLDSAELKLNECQAEYNNISSAGNFDIKMLETEITIGEKKINQGRETLENEKQKAVEKINSAKEELEKGKKEADEQLSDAEKELSDAQDKIDKLKNAEWYIYDRDDNPGYSGLVEDAERVDNIAKVFPLFFLIVASLVCLTTMSRMVEERRTETGTLKALGYSDRDISSKYIIYGSTAGIGGCIVGGFLGVITLPKIIVDTYGIMYMLPETKIVVSRADFFISSIVAVMCICLVAFISCRTDLKLNPATLMRPKAPKPGKRILLEYITPIWKNMSFTSKVTARNLFRYKARFLMTVIGVAGCTALIVAGFGLRDSITVIGDLQYVDISRYEQVYALSESGTASEKKDIISIFREDERFDSTMLSYMGFSSDVNSKKSKTSLNSRIIIGESYDDFKKMFTLRERLTHNPIELDDDSIVIDERMSDVLKIKKGDTINIKIDEIFYNCIVSGITENYAGNFIYMTPVFYKSITGNDAQYNVIITDVAEKYKDSQHDIANDYMQYDDIITVSLISEQVEAIMSTLDSLNIVTFVMIFCAGLLAMVVLYNLTNINIAERVREIATIKVLGFYSLETANYIYRENIILTLFGAVVGLFLGSLFTGFIVESIQMNNVMFPNIVQPMSYVWGFILTFAFSMLVNFIMYFKMNKISMVESLKSIE